MDLWKSLINTMQQTIMARRYCRVWDSNDQRLKAAVVVWDPRIHFAIARGTMSCPILQVHV